MTMADDLDHALADMLRRKVYELARTDPTVQATLTDAGASPWEETLTLMVLKLAREKRELHARLVDFEEKKRGYPVGLPTWCFPCGCEMRPEYRVMRTQSEPTDRWIPFPCEAHR